MADKQAYLTGKRILAVDDEVDILESIEDILDMADVDSARDYATASAKIKGGSYDLAILDIMGVNGLVLLEEAVAKGIPTVMLTAHAINPDTLMSSIRKGAISYLPKETLAELDTLLEELMAAQAAGKPPWKLLFDKLGDYFDERFGPDWKAKDKTFWSDFSRTWQVGRGIQERLKHDKRILDKGI
jgi:CheY-like chemotaxis protein